MTSSNIERELGEAAQIRVGYLEECLRHIDAVAKSYGRKPFIGLSQIRQLAQHALKTGDPLTCPEARK